MLVGTDTLTLAWAGGLNAPQLSHLDLDGDGGADLLAYEVAGETYIPLRRGADGRWRWAPERADVFPRGLGFSWVQLRDFNGDGRADFFADTLSGVRVFRNTTAMGQPPAFTPYEPNLQTRVLDASGLDTLLRTIYNGPTDAPGLMDIDGDGDLDMLTSDVFGVTLSYHRNFGMEYYGRMDTLLYYRASECWGHFQEDYDADLQLFSAELNYLVCEPREFGLFHSGGAVLPLHLNGDTLADVIFTDAGIDYAIALINGGTRRQAHMVSAEPLYPSPDPIRVWGYPGLYWLEVTGDGKRDLIAANQEPYNIGANHRSVWLYRNIGEDINPVWELHEKDFLQNQMLDVGASAQAVFGDLSGTGTPDMLLASGGRRYGLEDLTVFLQHYRNLGTAYAPVWQLADSNYLEVTAMPALAGVTELMPALADMDADGDTDLLLGFYRPAGNHRLLYFRNIAGPGNPAVLELVTDDFASLAAQNFTAPAPAFADVDLDGDLDIVLGDALGALHLIENRGTAFSPDYYLAASPWGGVNAMTEPGIPPFARPLVVELDGDPTPELLIGTAAGTMLLYDNISAGAGAVFTPGGTYGGLSVGRRAAPTAYAFTEDSLRLFVGTLRGGVQYTEIAGALPMATQRVDAGSLFRLYPNPARDAVWVGGPAGTRVEVYDLLGRLQQEATIPFSDASKELSLRGYRDSVYLVRFSWQGYTETLRLVVTSQQ